MKTNTLKLSFITVLAHILCMTVVLSHIHAKDAVSMISNPHAANKIMTKDITAKALNDLHQHIDKTSLKNVHADASTTAARVRELDALHTDDLPTSVTTAFHDFLLRFRVVTSLCYQYA